MGVTPIKRRYLIAIIVLIILCISVSALMTYLGRRRILTG